MADNKINPNHYKSIAGYEVIDIIEYFNLNFSKGNAIKYLLRSGRKEEIGYDLIDKEIEDLDKAAWYCQREKERLIKLKESK
tara:strand:- start:6762 stop:7007 length:246 start_codon:yes stop_codon:yes gene_type:complete